LQLWSRDRGAQPALGKSGTPSGALSGQKRHAAARAAGEARAENPRTMRRGWLACAAFLLGYVSSEQAAVDFYD